MSNIQIIQGDFEKKLKLQFAPGIKAGFPSPADDYSHETLDFNRDLIRNPEATFYGKVEGDSMIEAGINDGDIAVIDRSVEPQEVMWSWDISMMSSPSSTSTCVTERTATSSCVLQTRISSLYASMQMMTLKCGVL